MIFLIISAAITIFLLTALVVVTLSSREAIETRLMAVTSRRHPEMLLEENERLGLGGLASALTSFLKPIRDLVTGNDGELSYRMGLAGFRKPEHVEIFAAAKMLLPVLAIAGASFAGESMLAVALVGGAIGFFGPDLVITQMIARRRENIRHALPDALDLLVICMEAGLGIDQALVRVGDEIRTTSTDLADEFQVINREQRAGKPRLEAWRSMSDRLRYRLRPAVREHAGADRALWDTDSQRSRTICRHAKDPAHAGRRRKGRPYRHAPAFPAGLLHFSEYLRSSVIARDTQYRQEYQRVPQVKFAVTR